MTRIPPAKSGTRSLINEIYQANLSFQLLLKIGLNLSQFKF